MRTSPSNSSRAFGVSISVALSNIQFCPDGQESGCLAGSGIQCRLESNEYTNVNRA